MSTLNTFLKFWLSPPEDSILGQVIAFLITFSINTWFPYLDIRNSSIVWNKKFNLLSKLKFIPQDLVWLILDLFIFLCPFTPHPPYYFIASGYSRFEVERGKGRKAFPWLVLLPYVFGKGLYVDFSLIECFLFWGWEFSKLQFFDVGNAYDFFHHWILLIHFSKYYIWVESLSKWFKLVTFH